MGAEAGRGSGSTGAALARRWLVLAAYVAVLYGTLPFGPRVGLAVLRTRAGGWLLGPGLPVLALFGAASLMVFLRRRDAPPWAYAALVAAGGAYALAFSWLRAAHLERTHLPEYGLASLLAWRALVPLFPGGVTAYAAAAVVGAAIGYGDELLQSVVPGRHYDLRDVAMNAVGAVLGMVVLAAARARRQRPAARPAAVGVRNEPTSRRALHS
jgi:hypothetical protein